MVEKLVTVVGQQKVAVFAVVAAAADMVVTLLLELAVVAAEEVEHAD